MATNAQNRPVLRFNGIEVDPRSREVRRNGARFRLQDQPLAVLLLLVERQGEVVTREELKEKLWPAGTFVDADDGLNTAIRKLREVLHDSSERPRYVETIPRRGYRFIGKLEAEEPAISQLRVEAFEVLMPRSEEGPAGVTESNSSALHNGGSVGTAADPQEPIKNVAADKTILAKMPGEIRTFRRRWLMGAAILIIGLATAVWYLRLPPPPLRVTEYTRITHDGHQKDLVGTDGSRLYFDQQIDLQPIAQVAITGGEIAPISVPLPKPTIADVSPDGSSLIVSSFDGRRFSLWNFQVPGGSLRQLTGAWVDSDGWSFSPDRKLVAYVDSNGDINVMRIDGTEVRRLAAAQDHTGNSYTADLSWSPDSIIIRFTRDRKLWEVSSNGSGLHPLLPGWRPSSWQCCGHWTPDGKFFVFLLQDTFYRPALAGSQLWVLDERRGLFRRAPSEPVQLTSGPIQWTTPIPSKDRKKIFARGVVLRGELVRLDAKSRQLRPYLGGISAEFVTFSPDGKSVAYVTFPEGILWRANRDGNNPVQLTDPPIYPLNPRWSPDSSNILFNIYGSENALQNYIIPSQGGTPQPLVPEDKELIVDSNYSPDGRKIVFASREAEGGTFTRVLRVLDLASRQISTLPGSKGMWSPRWSPNGRFIAGYSPSRGIALFDIETQRWSKLQEGECDFPTWSRDSQFIYYLREWSGGKDPGVYRVRVSGGATERVVDLKGFRSTGSLTVWFGLDPTDTPMLIRDVGSDDIYALTLEQK
jgi:Tol biopolymer transport system component/DNA-binding winged helix-turn-helix (wHTH) protein